MLRGERGTVIADHQRWSDPNRSEHPRAEIAVVLAREPQVKPRRERGKQRMIRLQARPQRHRPGAGSASGFHGARHQGALKLRGALRPERRDEPGFDQTRERGFGQDRNPNRLRSFAWHLDKTSQATPVRCPDSKPVAAPTWSPWSRLPRSGPSAGLT